MKTPALLAALLAAGAAMTAAPDASAQATAGTIALDRFEPAPAGDATFGVPAPTIGGHLVPRFYLAFDYADKPLRIFGDGEETPLVEKQGILRLDASLALWDRLLVSLDIPAAVINSGKNPSTPGVTLRPPEGAALGDLRLGLRARLVGRDKSPFQASLGGYLFAPTGPAGAYTGDGAARGSLHAIFGGDIASRFVWSANGGALLSASAEPHLVTFGASAGVKLWDERIGAGKG